MCYFNRLTRVAHTGLQIIWNGCNFAGIFYSPPGIMKQLCKIFFLLARIFFSISFVLHAIVFFQQALAGKCFQNHPHPPPSRVKWSAPYHMFIFYLHRQLVLHISGINQNMLHEKMSQCKILIVPDLASLNIVHLQKNILRCVGFCFIRIGISS